MRACAASFSLPEFRKMETASNNSPPCSCSKGGGGMSRTGGGRGERLIALSPFFPPLFYLFLHYIYIFISILFRFNLRRWPASISLLSLLYITCVATISLLYFHLPSCAGRLLVSRDSTLLSICIATIFHFSLFSIFTCLLAEVAC